MLWLVKSRLVWDCGAADVCFLCFILFCLCLHYQPYWILVFYYAYRYGYYLLGSGVPQCVPPGNILILFNIVIVWTVICGPRVPSNTTNPYMHSAPCTFVCGHSYLLVIYAPFRGTGWEDQIVPTLDNLIMADSVHDRYHVAILLSLDFTKSS